MGKYCSELIKTFIFLTSSGVCRSSTEDVLREGESEPNNNPNEILSTPISAIQPSEFSGTRTLSLRGSRSLLPVSPSVEDPDLVTSRLDQEQGI